MRKGQFSRSAVGAAAHRAMHQGFEGGAIFADPYARAILDEAELRIAEIEAEFPASRSTRMFMAARSRLAEDWIAEAIPRGVRQVVVLGAGLDTFALRNPYVDIGLQVFEVDYPETQTLKRSRIGKITPHTPTAARFVSLDFETQSLGEALGRSDFNDRIPAFFMWLGVVPYLSFDSIRTTLQYIAGLPDSEIAFDYSEPLENYEPERRSRMVALGKRLADLGEPWVTHFDPPAIIAELHRNGFVEIDDLDLTRISERHRHAFGQIILRSAGPHIVHARNGNLHLTETG